MNEKIRITKIDELFCKIDCERSTLKEISEKFSFKIENARFNPKVKSGLWDGIIRLVDLRKRTIYTSLLYDLKSFCESRNYEIEIDKDVLKTSNEKNVGILLSKALNTFFTPRDYQDRAIDFLYNIKKGLLLCPTGSGKSFIIYLLTRYHEMSNRRVLIIVPTISLIYQLQSNFNAYANNDIELGTIKSGSDKYIDKKIIISTWQSIYKLDKKWFESFDVIIGDEAHLFNANSLKTIVHNCSHMKYRYGLTGTIKDSKTHSMVLKGLFGPIYQVIKTKELMDKDVLSKLKIKLYGLMHPKNKKMKYHDEISYLISNEKRNHFIVDLADSLEGNTLILFSFVDKHGKILYDIYNSKRRKNACFFVSGEVPGEKREEIRKRVDSSTNNTIIASYQTFSTGIDIVNLDNLILASPSKSRIRILQSIGRILRKSNKDYSTLYDIADDIGVNSSYSKKHFNERLSLYKEEEFKVDFVAHKLGE